MSDDLDLSGLTDDQLVQMARLVAVEIGRRTGAVRTAAEAAVLDETEKARVWRDATEEQSAILRDAERRRIREEAAAAVRAAEAARNPQRPPPPNPRDEDWAKNKTIALMIRETLGKGWQCHAWRRGDVRRVYFDHEDGRKVILHVTGSDRHPPGKLETQGLKGADRARLKIVAAHVAVTWLYQPQFSCDEAAETALAAKPYPAAYTAHLQKGSTP